MVETSKYVFGFAHHYYLRKILDQDEVGQELAYLKTQMERTTVLLKELFSACG